MATIEDLKALFKDSAPHEVAIEINGFTGFRTTLIEELTQDEIQRLYEIHRPKTAEPSASEFKAEMERKKWRSYILTIVQREGIKEPNSWERFNHWMLHSSRFKKALKEHSLDELKALHQQLMKMKDNNRKNKNKEIK